jgi:hypothetical protein
MTMCVSLVLLKPKGLWYVPPTDNHDYIAQTRLFDYVHDRLSTSFFPIVVPSLLNLKRIRTFEACHSRLEHKESPPGHVVLKIRIVPFHVRYDSRDLGGCFEREEACLKNGVFNFDRFRLEDWANGRFRG